MTKSRRLSRRDFGVAAMGIVLSGLLTLVGAGNIPRLWMLLATVTLSAVLVAVTHAVDSAFSLESRMNALWGCVGLLSIFVTGIAVYHQWFDPARSQTTYAFVINGTDVQGVFPSGEPGGPPIKFHGDLIGGHTYEFECSVTVEGEEWIQLADEHWWIPRSTVHAPAGMNPPEIPDC